MDQLSESSGSRMFDDEFDYSISENKTGSYANINFLLSMPELFDVTFFVGDTKEPVYAVKTVLAARSRVFHKMLFQTPNPQQKKDLPTQRDKIQFSQPEACQHHTLIIKEFESDVFRQLIEYIHTESVTLQLRTLIGLISAAEYYGLDDLKRACVGFGQYRLTIDTVCTLLASADRYIQYKYTRSLVQKVLEFVDKNGKEVLNLESFTLLPQHVVQLILARKELRANEFTKFQAVLRWSKKYCDSNKKKPLKYIISNFIEYIQFHKIPVTLLKEVVNPLGLVPPEIITNAMSCQMRVVFPYTSFRATRKHFWCN